METSELLRQGQELVTTFGVKIIAAITILVVGRWVAKSLTRSASFHDRSQVTRQSSDHCTQHSDYEWHNHQLLDQTPASRHNLIASVGYNDDLDKVKQVLTDILAKDDRVLKDPAPTIAIMELADSSVNVVVRPWVKSADY